MSLTILGGKGFVLGAYVRNYYHHAIGNIASINEREDLKVYSEDVLMGISTVHNYNIFTDVHLDINTNLNLLMTVLENWKRTQDTLGKPGVFNFISSWSVYGNQAKLPVAENAPCDPKGMYIITKHCAEQLLRCYCETFHLNYRILRLANVVGPGDNPSEQKNILQFNINKLARGEDVTLFGDGKFFRDFIHVDDVARAIETVMTKGAVNEIYNIGLGDPWEYDMILKYAIYRMKSTGLVRYTEATDFQKKTPVASFYMDVTKLRNLGFVPEYTDGKLYNSLLPKEL
jgi:nucleoside-diphosphate-sugar epimerase